MTPGEEGGVRNFTIRKACIDNFSLNSWNKCISNKNEISDIRVGGVAVSKEPAVIDDVRIGNASN